MNKQQSVQKSVAWKASVLTLFPEMMPGCLGFSLAGKALADGFWDIETINLRDFADNKPQTVDDAPFGGGAGMVIRPDVVDAALKSVPHGNRPIIYLSPRGQCLNQSRVQELAKTDGVILLCGRYEGIDNRVIDAWKMEEISIGDFVLSGGEPAAITLIDACVRLLPGVVGNAETTLDESFVDGLLEYSHYTRPQVWEGRRVPKVLLSGHHSEIRECRKMEAEKVTYKRRPDLWSKYISGVKETQTKH
jgi:tRNA (guanine37-N1)-methyltransferase